MATADFSSSNKKVASVNAKGKLKALRLGVTKITVYSNKKKQSYKITVVPKSDKDVRLKQSLFLKGQIRYTVETHIKCI